MHEITDALVLMAGSGSRLRASGEMFPKPLVPILGRPLISYTLEAMANAGITTAYAVVGHESRSLIEQVQPLAPPALQLRFLDNPDWQKQNGLSVLAAADYVASPFVLTMSDHLFDESILDRLIRDAVLDELNLAIDRKLDSIFDRDDAMKVQTRGERIVTLGKDLKEYDAIDTGVFVCTADIFHHLDRAKHRLGGDCSLADGVRSMAGAGLARAVDIGTAWWQDVDTLEMLRWAEQKLRT